MEKNHKKFKKPELIPILRVGNTSFYEGKIYLNAIVEIENSNQTKDVLFLISPFTARKILDRILLELNNLNTR